MANFCTKCGSSLDENNKCPNCSILVSSVKEDKEVKAITTYYIFYSGLAQGLTLTLWITAILEAWIMEPSGENPYFLFWVGIDQYFAYFTTLIVLTLGILTFIYSGAEYRRGLISKNIRLLAIFIFITTFFFLYIAAIGFWWQA